MSKAANCMGIIAGVIGGAIGIYSVWRGKKLEAAFGVSTDIISEKIPVEISQKTLQVASGKAVRKAAEQAAKEVSEAMGDMIEKQVKEAIDTSYDTIAASVKESLEQQLKNVDLSKIQAEVVKDSKAAIVDSALKDLRSMVGFGGRPFSSDNSMSDIIKTCTNAGMASWEIKNILDSLKNAK